MVSTLGRILSLRVWTGDCSILSSCTLSRSFHSISSLRRGMRVELKKLSKMGGREYLAFHCVRSFRWLWISSIRRGITSSKCPSCPLWLRRAPKFEVLQPLFRYPNPRKSHDTSPRQSRMHSSQSFIELLYLSLSWSSGHGRILAYSGRWLHQSARCIWRISYLLRWSSRHSKRSSCTLWCPSGSTSSSADLPSQRCLLTSHLHVLDSPSNTRLTARLGLWYFFSFLMKWLPFIWPLSSNFLCNLCSRRGLEKVRASLLTKLVLAAR